MSLFSDFLSNVKSAASNTADVFINDNVKALEDKAASLFVATKTGATALINNTINGVPAKSVVSPAVPANPLPPDSAASVSVLPSYTIPLTIGGILLLILLFKRN